MNKSGQTRVRRLMAALRLCPDYCLANGVSAGCAHGEHGKSCGPSNCAVYRQVIADEKRARSAGDGNG